MDMAAGIDEIIDTKRALAGRTVSLSIKFFYHSRVLPVNIAAAQHA
jgi:hypothetical protein